MHIIKIMSNHFPAGVSASKITSNRILRHRRLDLFLITVFIISPLNKTIGKQLKTKSILDIMPTILDLFGIPIPDEFEGESIKI